MRSVVLQVFVSEIKIALYIGIHHEWWNMRHKTTL